MARGGVLLVQQCALCCIAPAAGSAASHLTARPSAPLRHPVPGWPKVAKKQGLKAQELLGDHLFVVRRRGVRLRRPLQAASQRAQRPSIAAVAEGTTGDHRAYTASRLRRQVPGALSIAEAQAFIDGAERAGFEHQGSRGAAYGEAFRCAHSCACLCTRTLTRTQLQAAGSRQPDAGSMRGLPASAAANGEAVRVSSACVQ